MTRNSVRGMILFLSLGSISCFGMKNMVRKIRKNLTQRINEAIKIKQKIKENEKKVKKLRKDLKKHRQEIRKKPNTSAWWLINCSVTTNNDMRRMELYRELQELRKRRDNEAPVILMLARFKNPHRTQESLVQALQ